MGRGISWVIVAASAHVAFAQPRSEPVPVLGAQPVLSAPATSGFIDDVVAAEGDRLVYTITDGTTKAALHIANVATKHEQIVDIATVTMRPLVVQLVGDRVFVAGASEDKQVAALIELVDKGKRKAGSVVYKLGPADHITLIARDGKPRVAVHRQTEQAGVTKHTVELVALETGRRIKAGRPLALGAGGEDKQLGFRVNHWSDGWTRAHGIKIGEWDRKEDTRAPDQEATLDLVTGKLERKKIEDLFDQKRRFAALASIDPGGGKLDFVRVKQDLTGLELWRAGTSRALELDQPFQSYDPKSLQYAIAPDGSGWLAIKVDPVNPEAVARKRADPEYLDIFRFTAGGQAVREARILAKGVRHRFGAGGTDRFWLLERNAGFERGGKSVTLYQLQ